MSPTALGNARGTVRRWKREGLLAANDNAGASIERNLCEFTKLGQWRDRPVDLVDDPAAVARLAYTHGWDAVLERWSWIDRRTLGILAAIGRQPTNERIAA